MKYRVKNNLKFDCRQNFLISAINDISGNIKFLDTKIGVLLATIGVMIGALASCGDNILNVYSQFVCCEKMIINVMIYVYFLFTVMSFVFGISTIIPRSPKLQNQSLWYGVNNLEYTDFKNKIFKADKNLIISSLCCQLYTLNVINSIKMKNTKRTVICFSISCGILAVLLIKFICI